MKKLFTLLFFLTLMPVLVEAQLASATPTLPNPFKLEYIQSVKYKFRLTNQTDRFQDITVQTYDLLATPISDEKIIKLEPGESSEWLNLFKDEPSYNCMFILQCIGKDKQSKVTMLTKKIILVK